MPHIVILTHKYSEDFEDSRYHMRYVAELWREDGHVVTVLRGPDKFVEADMAVLHVDETRISSKYVDLINRYPKSINSRVVDISKRIISTNILESNDGYDGPVIVKTDLNFGGEVEGRIASRISLALRVRGAIRRRLPWGLRSEISANDYRVYKRRADVPGIVWLNKDLVVEKFLPERSGEDYCLRTWVFLGDKETHSISYSKDPVVKSHNVHLRTSGTGVPDELRQIRKDRGFDYGKFDYVVSEGKPVLYDANRSPTRGISPGDPFMERMRILADGLDSVLSS